MPVFVCVPALYASVLFYAINALVHHCLQVINASYFSRSQDLSLFSLFCYLELKSRSLICTKCTCKGRFYPNCRLNINCFERYLISLGISTHENIAYLVLRSSTKKIDWGAKCTPKVLLSITKVQKRYTTNCK